MLPFVIGFEALVWLAGLYLLWRVVLGPRGLRSSALAPWPVSLEGFVIAILLVTASAWFLPQVTAHLSNAVLGPAASETAWWMVVQGGSFQLGLLGGALLVGLYFRYEQRRAPDLADVLPTDSTLIAQPSRHPLLAGAATFLISIPLITGLAFIWKALLERFGFPTDEQEMIDLFRDADNPTVLVCMVVLAAVVAPVTEELIFRAGLFRYLRTRIPRWFALTIPALIFALLHSNLAASVPLFALGLFFALAYERTGRIAVPMIAHALFNLHTIVMVMAGVST